MNSNMIVTIDDFKTDFRRNLFADEIIKSVNDEKASQIYFIGIKDSESLLSIITSKSSDNFDNYHFIEVTRPDSFNSTFAIVISKLQDFINDKTVIDLTFASKILAVCLTIIAKNKNAFLKYNSKVLDINPSNYTLDVVDNKKSLYDLEVVVDYFNNHQFFLALNYLNRSDIDVNIKGILNSLIMFYHNLDHFIYDYKLDLNKLSNHENITFKSSIIESNIKSMDFLDKDKSYDVCYDIANLINNARRRFDEENYDDAISRLYSAVELIFTEKLKDYGFTKYNNNVEIFNEWNIPVDMVKNVNSYIPVNTQYKILKLLNDPIGLTYSIYAKKGVNIIHMRNNTHINHGMLVISHDVYKELEEEVITVAKLLAYDIQDLIYKTRFARIELKDNKNIIIR